MQAFLDKISSPSKNFVTFVRHIVYSDYTINKDYILRREIHGFPIKLNSIQKKPELICSQKVVLDYALIFSEHFDLLDKLLLT